MEPGIIALITAIVVLAGAIVKFAANLQKNIDEIHVLVNDRMTETLNRIDQLTLALEDANIQVPRAPGRDGDG